MSAVARLAAALVLSWASLCAAHAQQGQPPKVQNYNAPGNLEQTADLGCIALKDAAPRYTPVDLFRAAGTCISAHRYDDGARLFVLAGAYGRFDMLRVADTTAHQAILVIRSEIFGDLPQADSDAFSASLKTIIVDGKLAPDLCATIQRIGAPTYHPRYMIQHGMGAFTGNKGNGLVDKFDADAAWKQVRADYLKCAAK
ncbi:hypothetical protein [Sphingomonas sp. KR3-1]|uniref:hypothetical protein n=1 Tax=Sphingomonas sp. KR3-1 TaxID=3156611 RepID=UPI0032B4F255